MRSPRNFLTHTGGVAFIEFALILPFLLVLLFGGIEVVRLIYIQQKVEKAGYVIADVIASYKPATIANKPGEISENLVATDVFPIFGRIMGEGSTGGFKDPARQAIIITSVSPGPMNMNIVNWQISSPEDSNTDNALNGCDRMNRCTVSIVNGAHPGGTNPAVHNVTADFDHDATANWVKPLIPIPLPAGENMIVVEIFYQYTPLLKMFLEDSNLASLAHTDFLLPENHIYAKRVFFIPRNGPLTALPPLFPVNP